MFKHYFEGIYNVHIWPMISFAVFFVFFIALLIWVLKVDKGYIQRMKHLPLDSDPDDMQEDTEDVKRNGSAQPKETLFSRYRLGLRNLLLTGLAFFWPILSWGQTETGNDQDTMFMAILVMVILVAILVLILAVYLVRVLNLVLRKEKERKAVEQGIAVAEEPSWWSRWQGKMTEAVPIGEEDTVLLDHNYDGIRELDNHLPPWWKYLFYITIVFAIGYVLVYHVFESLPLQTEAYQAELAEAASIKQARLAAEPELDINESNITFIDDPTHLSNGQKVFEGQCASCHTQSGGGNIGPNLTDEYWILGGSISQIFATIKNGGRPGKGMIGWEPFLSSTQMSEAASYVMTLQGTNPPNAKAPEGEKYMPEETTGQGELPVDSVAVEAESIDQ